MSILLSCQDLAKIYPSKTIFSGLNFGLHEKQRVGLVGPNGAGKSSLVKILAGVDQADEGSISKRRGLKIVWVEQDKQWPEGLTTYDYLFEYAKVQGLSELDASVEAASALSQAGFEDTQVKVTDLSGGWKKRLLICQSLIANPDLVFFDEPTNHLDWQGLDWLESLLKQANFSWLLVTHDRYLLKNLAKQIAELSPVYEEGIKFYDGNYEKYLEARQIFLDELASQQSSMANKARREQEWLRQGVKARGTKSRSRIESAQALIASVQELKQRLSQEDMKLEFNESGRKTKKLWEAKKLSFSYPDGKCVLKDLSLGIYAKQAIGVLGGNGSGKSTLLKLIAGELEATQGQLETAKDLRVVYFSQERADLDLSSSVQDNICIDGTDFVQFQGRSIHVATWIKRFKLATEQLKVDLNKLSGGERARVAMAKLMLLEADILLLDEPTNDLDLETVEILEAALSDLKQSFVLVSHDRVFLENLCDYYIGLDPQNGVGYFASIEQWQESLKSDDIAKKKTETKRSDKRAKTKLSYKEKRELEMMESMILEAEEQMRLAELALEKPEIMGEASAMLEASNMLSQAQSKVETLYARWEELEALQAHLENN